ncbi:hypothetical protein IU431_23355 [Nocardia otitidiscaviarum]|uniref:TPR repeat region-containing protein n=1 Tax=Nocardia otitidiscaviarum TaxID=1823 RepID=UPI0004A6C7CE|nr:hypothetical protein [Nocardia otitidiscaviarum]MBF6487063.1 hypothetical protein [Nocardia otitidiscaviarum]
MAQEWNLTRANVTAWRTSALSDLAATIEAAAKTYGELSGSMPTHFANLNGSWAGNAHDAAYNRVGEEHRESLKVGDEVDDVVTALRAADTRLHNERENLLNKVADAEDPAGAVAGETYTVNDSWLVGATKPEGVTDEQAKQIRDNCKFHQDAIRTALLSLRDAAMEEAQKIVAASGEARDRGIYFGDGINSPLPEGGLVNDSELGYETGREDGIAIADGTATDAQMQRIAARLAETGLTPDQLEALANGQEVTVPLSSMAYLTEFYASAGRDGLLEFATQLESNGSPQAIQLRENLANGLMTLSNDKVVVRDGVRPSGVVRGGYDRLPPEIRELVGTRPGLDTPDGNTREVPDDYRTGGLFGNNSGASPDYQRDLGRFASLVNAAGEGYEPGQQFGMELTRQGAHLAGLADAWSGGGSYDGAGEQTIQNFVGAGTRSDEANYALLTGNGPEELFGKDTPGQAYDGYHRDDVIVPLLQHGWSDDGAALSEMFTWTNEDARITDPGNPAQIERAERAGEAAYGLAQLLSTTESGANGANLYENWLDMPGHDGQSLGEVNPVATKALAAALAPYTLDLVDANDDLKNTAGFGPLGGPVEAARVFSVLNTDSEAAAIINSAALAEAERIDGIYADRYANGEEEHLLGTQSGDLRWAVHAGIDAEIADRQLNADEADTARQQKYAAAYTAGQIMLGGFGPGYAGAAAVTEFFKNDIIAVDETFVNPFPELEIRNAEGAEFKGYNPAEVGDSTNRMYAMMQGLVDGGHIDPATVPEVFRNADGTLKPYVQLSAEAENDDILRNAINKGYNDLPAILKSGGLGDKTDYTDAVTESGNINDREVLYRGNSDSKVALESVLKNDSANSADYNRWRHRN